MKRHPGEHPDENRDEGAGRGQERGACCALVRSEEFRAEPGPVPSTNLLAITLLAITLLALPCLQGFWTP